MSLRQRDTNWFEKFLWKLNSLEKSECAKKARKLLVSRKDLLLYGLKLSS